MDSTNREEMNNRRRYAEAELYKMQERATMPPVPPFVRTAPQGGNAEREMQENPAPSSEKSQTERIKDGSQLNSNLSGYNPFGGENSTDSRESDGPAVFRQPPHKKPTGIGGLLSKDIFKLLNVENLELGSDRMLLLLMILLLSGENSDNILLFALAYIML